MLLTPELEASFRQRYNPDGSSLRKAQLRMVDMLMWFDEIMRKHGCCHGDVGRNRPGGVCL